MIRRVLLAAALWLVAQPVLAATQIVVTSGTTWTAPADWSDSGATVELLGGGAQGGGAYAKKTSPGLAPGQVVSIQIGAGVAAAFTAGDTCFISCATVKAAGAIANQGGTVANSVGDTKFRGGNANNGGNFGGGGAAGLHGNGGDSTGAAGATGDAGFGGAGSPVSGNGGNGTEWGTVGSGGGSGRTTTCFTGCNGGLYGGGGSIESGSSGAQGLIVITYTPKQRTASGVF